MKVLVPILSLISSSVIYSYLVLLVGKMVPTFFQVAFRETPKQAKDIMPSITLIASEHAELFVVMIVLILLSALFGLKRYPKKLSEITLASFCSQGLVLWVAFFCYCYFGFCGPMCLHHDYEIEFGKFITFGVGIFPVTLTALLAPLIVLGLSGFRRTTSARHKKLDYLKP